MVSNIDKKPNISIGFIPHVDSQAQQEPQQQDQTKIQPT